MTAHSHPGSLLKELDLDKAQFLALIERSRRMKAANAERTEVPTLAGRNIARVVDVDSARTCGAFDIAAHDQGAYVAHLGLTGSRIGGDRSMADAARILGSVFDGIELRGCSQEALEEFAEHAGVPVWNGFTDQWHPTQMLADILTMTENFAGTIEEIVFCYLGDGRTNVARSLLITGALLGMDVRIAAPRELWPPDDVIDTAEDLAAFSDARVLVTSDAGHGALGADFLHTDAWVSMHESPEVWAARVPMLHPYRVDADMMESTGKPDTRFLHCLPSLHQSESAVGRRFLEVFGPAAAEVSAEVFESKHSLVPEQADNRVHTIKAVLTDALAP